MDATQRADAAHRARRVHRSPRRGADLRSAAARSEYFQPRPRSQRSLARMCVFADGAHLPCLTCFLLISFFSPRVCLFSMFSPSPFAPDWHRARELLASPRRAATDHLVSALVTARAYYPCHSSLRATLARWIYADNVQYCSLDSDLSVVNPLRGPFASRFSVRNSQVPIFSVAWLFMLRVFYPTSRPT